MSYFSSISEKIGWTPSIPSFMVRAHEQASDAWNMIKNPPYQEIDAQLSRVEGILNKLGWIPGVSYFSGEAREWLGRLQMIMGAVFGIIRNIVAKFTNDQAAKERLYKQAEVDFSYCMNGFGNVVRARIERREAWDVWNLVTNKVALFSYDAIGLRFNYGHEVMSSRDIPLLRSFEQRV